MVLSNGIVPNSVGNFTQPCMHENITQYLEFHDASDGH